MTAQTMAQTTTQILAQSPPTSSETLPPLHLKLQPDLLESNKQDQSSAAVFGKADHIDGVVDTQMDFDGHAELRKPGVVVKADHIRYTNLEDEVFAQGAVRIVRDGDVYTGPELRLRLDDSHGYFLEPEYALSHQPGRGQATRADFIDKDNSHLIDATYTTCTAANTDWYLQAASIDLDQNTQTGVAKSAVIYFKGMPILGFPWVSFPLNEARKSGFLPPTIGLSSNNGLEILLPYYWNMAPNRDLTLYPKFINRRGMQLGADFRYLEPHYSGDLRYEILPSDHEAQGMSRYSFFSIHQWSDPNGWSAAWNVNAVSDDNYFVDFSHTIAASSQRTLPRQGSISYGASDWTLTGQVLRYQTLQDPNAPITPPYEKLPELMFHGAELDRAGFDLTLDVTATQFWHPTQTRGDRFIFNPSISYPFLQPGWFVTPKLAYSATQYSNLYVPGVATTGPTSFHRNLPIFSVDSGLIFEKETSFLDKTYLQSLEPRVFYVRKPYRDQSLLPNFDSSLADFNFAQIFSDNTFVGSDRIADANQLTFGMTTRFIDPNDGSERFRAAIGQRFYLSPQRVTLPGGTPVADKKSDFLVEASGETLPHLFVDSALEYSPAVKGVSKSSFGIRWQPVPTEVLNAEYRYVRQQIEQVDVSAQWPLGAGWYGVGRMNYSTRDRKVVESVAGLEYKGCCWVTRFVVQRYATGALTATTSFFIQLELNGLGHVGTNPLEALKRNITGYQAINPPAPPVSPFNNYE